MTRPDDESNSDLEAIMSLVLRASAAIDPARLDRVGRQLLVRVQGSAQGQQGLTTSRREDLHWLQGAPGAYHCILRQDLDFCVELVRLDPGLSLCWPAEFLANEVLVMRGAVALEDSEGAAVVLRRYGYHVQALYEANKWRSLESGTMLYVRHRLAKLCRIDPREAAWWETAQVLPAYVGGADQRWLRVGEGIETLPLYCKEDVASGLMRVASGAAIPDHRHEIEEDCYVLQGDIFLSDVLLRAGDYHKASSDGVHSGCRSERGALFYFHGAVPRLLAYPASSSEFRSARAGLQPK
jgi:hypothetical protein